MQPTSKQTLRSDATKTSKKNRNHSYTGQSIPINIIFQGGVFEPIDPKSFKQTSAKADQIQQLLQEPQPKAQINDSERKYAIKVRQDVQKYAVDQVVNEQSYNEQTKTAIKKIEEIYNHTHQKVDQVVDRVINEFNKEGSYNSDLNQILKPMSQNIAFPLSYVAPPSYIDMKKQEIHNANNIKLIQKMDEIKNRGKNIQFLFEKEIAQILIDPHKVSQLENSFQVYKLKGQGSKPKMMIKMTERNQKQTQQVKDLIEEVKASDIILQENLLQYEQDKLNKNKKAKLQDQDQDDTNSQHSRSYQYNLEIISEEDETADKIKTHSDINKINSAQNQSSQHKKRKSTVQLKPRTINIQSPPSSPIDVASSKLPQIQSQQNIPQVQIDTKKSTTRLHSSARQTLPKIDKVTYVEQFITKKPGSPLQGFLDDRNTQLPTRNGINKYIVSRSPERRNSLNPNMLLSVGFSPINSRGSLRSRTNLMIQKISPVMTENQQSDSKINEQVGKEMNRKSSKVSIEHDNRIKESRQIVQDLEKYLAYNSYVKDIRTSDFKQQLERFRADQFLLTTKTLQNLDYIDTKHIKKLYNYSLNVLREKDETQDDASQEYLWNKSHITPFMAILNRQQEEKASMKGMRKKIINRKLELIYDKKKNSS